MNTEYNYNLLVDITNNISHCLDLDLNEQKTGASSDDGFIFKKINNN